MMLEVAELGLGSTFSGNFNDTIREAFALPDYIIPVALLPVGYASSDSVPNQLHCKRYDINKTVYFNIVVT
ncbi:hypothetical protein [Clostridium estertheticum]|uniref:hypothetical protein n=1 Tax=Clostridium estertheticum TaxID=238834 RepID=UPI001C0CC2E7|nr:hypothetical protein [Clostridium estertheticum]MBU3186212.1 hypothetical protein [Clostridium estertheticum]